MPNSVNSYDIIVGGVGDDSLHGHDHLVAGDEQNNPCSQVSGATGRMSVPCGNDEHYRNLARCSIICGCSCIGIQALENSFKAERTTDKEAAARLSKRAKNLSIISIVTFFGILVSLPLLTVFISYLVTLKD